MTRRLNSMWFGVLALGCVSAAAQERSVRPGINEPYRNPDVHEFVGRFERPGREVYDRRLEIVAACRIKPGMAVADVGAGTGLFSRMFSAEVGPTGQVYAVDISDEFVQHVERTCRERGLRNVAGVVCGTDSVDLPAGSIDLAFLCATYHHLEFPNKTMRSIRQALRPGGQVILIDDIRREGVSSEWVLNHVRAGQETFVAEIEAAGFHVVEERPFLKEYYFVRFEKSDTARGRVARTPAKPTQ